MPNEEAILGGVAAAGTLMGTLLGAFGMKRRNDLDRSDLAEEVKRMSERIVRLEIHLDGIRAERLREHDAYERLLARIDSISSALSRIETIFSMERPPEHTSR